MLKRSLGVLAVLASTTYGRELESLAHEFGVSGRTMYRDVLALEAAGFPIERLGGDLPGERCRWRIARSQSVVRVLEAVKR
jgi:hypothetical protein